MEHQDRAAARARTPRAESRLLAGTASDLSGASVTEQPTGRDKELLRYAFWPSANSPSEARARTAPMLGDGMQAEDILVLVSELVTNAVIHTAREAELRVMRRSSGCPPNTARPVIRVEVRDRHRSVPTSPPTSGAHGGFGLRIVAAVADAWGCTVLPDGKVVWFEVSADE